jgi:hypothetical protein
MEQSTCVGMRQGTVRLGRAHNKLAERGLPACLLRAKQGACGAVFQGAPKHLITSTDKTASARTRYPVHSIVVLPGYHSTLLDCACFVQSSQKSAKR